MSENKTTPKRPASDWRARIGEAEAGWHPVSMPFSAFSRSFVSGDPESRAIRIAYFRHPDHPGLGATVTFGPHAEGPPGHAHGGSQAAVLDEMCGGIAWLEGHPVVAVNLSIDFRRMVPLNAPLRAYAAMLRVEGRKVFTEAWLYGESGVCHAEGKGLFVRLDDASVAALRAKAGGPDGDAP